MSGPNPFIHQIDLMIRSGRGAQAAAAALSYATQVKDSSFASDLALKLMECKEHRAALKLYERAAHLAPNDLQHLYNRAAAKRVLGDLEGARADYDLLLGKDPEFFDAYLNRSELDTQTPERNHVQQLESVLASGVPDWRGEVALRYAAAKECEDLGQYDRSFAHLRRGALLRRRHLDYDLRQDLDTVEWIIEAFGRYDGPTAPAQGPIFIVGLPRTGSTLLERALGRHPDIIAGSELPCFTQALVTAVRNATPRGPFNRRDLVANAARIDFAALGRDYLTRVLAHGAHGSRFTDKLPLNYLYCGLIMRALPRARIIHISRHPMATGYAMYKTLFRDGYPFSYDLTEIAGYIAGYRRLMGHWHAVLPHALCEVRYEDLISDFPNTIRRLLNFCGLYWHDECANPTSNESAETSASAAQVRRPLYVDAVERWRCYREGLEPLYQGLQAANITDLQ
jgi:tetratricopeptide (TPR) repeat protein